MGQDMKAEIKKLHDFLNRVVEHGKEEKKCMEMIQDLMENHWDELTTAEKKELGEWLDELGPLTKEFHKKISGLAKDYHKEMVKRWVYGRRDEGGGLGG